MNKTSGLIVFDLYGTLIQFGVKHHPFRRILAWAKDRGRTPKPDDAKQLMTINKNPRETLAELSIYPPETMLKKLELDISLELESLSLFDDVTPTLNTLVDREIPIAICSNLARPYGVVIDKLLSDFDFIRCLSYEIGAIKPESDMYRSVISLSGTKPENIIFVGDTKLADCDGPNEFGFNGFHLVRGANRSPDTIGSLAEVLSIFYDLRYPSSVSS